MKTRVVARLKVSLYYLLQAALEFFQKGLVVPWELDWGCRYTSLRKHLYGTVLDPSYAFFISPIKTWHSRRGDVLSKVVVFRLDQVFVRLMINILPRVYVL